MHNRYYITFSGPGPAYQGCRIRRRLATTGNGTVATTTFTSAAAGSYVELTITNDSGADRTGWGIGLIDNDWDGGNTNTISEVTAGSLPDQASMTEQVSVADIIAGATETDVIFNIYNGCILDSLVLNDAKLIIFPVQKSLFFYHFYLFCNIMANYAIKIYPEIY